jgi:hypothetical protein
VLFMIGMMSTFTMHSQIIVTKKYENRADEYIASEDCYIQCTLTDDTRCTYYSDWVEDCANAKIINK